MRSIKTKSSALLGIFLFAGCASAATVYTTNLLPGNEVPPTMSTASGFATLTLTGNSLAVDILFNGLTAPATAAHIHCCGPEGTNFSVALPFTGFPAMTGGHYTMTFDLTLTSTYLPAFLSASGGTAASAEATLLAGLNAGQDYVNIHDSTYPGGEIRGFATATPEPGTLLLGATLLIGIGLIRRRR